MFRNYMLISFRNIWKHKGYSIINILGLAIGLMSCLFIIMYILYETSYDGHHDKADRIVRIVVNGALGGNEFQLANSCAPLAPTLLSEFPEVESVTRVRGNFGFPVFRYKNAVFSEEHWSAADSSFFDVFSIEFLQGSAETALNRPRTIILTESTAKRYFGEENPIGKLLNMDNRMDWEVTAVIRDFPPNSHFYYDMLSSLVTYPEMANNDMWVSNNFYTYAVLREGSDPMALEAKLPMLITKYVGPSVEKMTGLSFSLIEQQGGSYSFHVQKLRDIHLHSHLDGEHKVNGNPATIYVFLMIAVFILIIACINYMNLATAKYTNRTKEVGIRKTLGSTRGQLISQFLTESVLLTFISVALAILLIEIFLPRFNEMVDANLTLTPLMILGVFLTAAVVGVFAGSYPSFYLSAYDPTQVFRARVSRNGKSNLLRNGLVLFQFTISIVLLIGALVVSSQLNYMQNKQLGLNPDQVLIVEKTDDIGQHIQAFRDELRGHPGIRSVSNSTSIPGDIQSAYQNVMRVAGDSEENMQLVQNLFVDYDFLSTYEIELAEGRFFSEDYPSDSLCVVINEAAARVFGFDDPLQKRFVRDMGQDDVLELSIIGVMKDFHFESPQKEIRPMVIYHFNRQAQFGKFVSVRLNSADFQTTLAFIEKTWKKFAKDQAFEYVLFDQHYEQQYHAQVLARQIVTQFTILAMFIACLGLFGLASFTAEKRTKEIGIRKVLGASVPSLILFLSLEFTKWVLWANLIAFPIAWLVLSKWLENFAYRISINPFTFVLSGILALIIALITVSMQTVKAATSNPVTSLRFE